MFRHQWVNVDLPKSLKLYPSSQRHNLPWIHDVIGIERLFDGRHGGNGRRAELLAKIFHLAFADAVLAGAGSIHCQRAVNEALANRFGGFDLVGIGHVDQEREVEIAVSDVTQDRRHQTLAGNVALGLCHAFGKPRNRYAHVGRECLRAGAQRLCCPIGVVARLPQTRAIFSLGGPFKCASLKIGCDLAEARRLLGDTCL